MTKIINKISGSSFRIGDSVVYPSHGVGVIANEESQIIAGFEQQFYVIAFEKDKMTLKVPKSRAEKTGLRHLSSSEDLKKALTVLKGKAKIAKGMWSKRAQEYDAKINSGDLVFIAEVLRDLYRNVDDAGRSYSERLIYDAAFKRFSNEYAATANINLEQAIQEVKNLLEDARILYEAAA